MIKLVYCLRRLPHLSRAEFQRYWRETHGPLVRSHAEVLRIRRYVQVHTLDDPLNDVIGKSRGAAEAYDGVAELWFERVEDLAESTSTPEGRTAALELLEDERRFIDVARSAIFVAEEHLVIAESDV
jgi:uncharacterized protein (TIGR02118 family)